MCGIVGYIGKKPATPFLLSGLSALEYRGYDSAGIFVSDHGAVRRAGKVSALIGAVPPALPGTLGIGHTRWATHGAPTERNAHPHTDARETIWLVHNGIIENHAAIRARLEAEGVVFASETDTEALAQLIGRIYQDVPVLEEAVALALKDVEGAYGIVVASTREKGKLVAARHGSPLLVGIGDDGFYLASDATPVLPHTRRVVYLEEGELAVLRPDVYHLYAGAVPVSRPPQVLDWNIEATQMKGYEHFMLKEIMEVPEVIENALRGRIDLEAMQVHLGGLQDVRERLRAVKRIIITGCGSAYYAGLTGELLIEELAGIPVETEIASELRYRRWTADPESTILIAVSQSGETADTLEAVREAKRAGLLTLGVVNAVGSSIARATDAGVYNHAGPEIGVASTKAFISQLVVLTLIALYLKQLRGGMEDEMLRELTRLPDYARRVLEGRGHIEGIATRFAGMRDALYIGRKFQYPIAYEGALKLKEVSYLHAEAYGAGEMKHGPLALIDSKFPTVALMPRDSMYEKTRSNVEEIKARGGKVVTVTTEDETADADTILVPKTLEPLLPVLTTLALQLLAYFVARERGLPIDMPRNLAKSVTVE